MSARPERELGYVEYAYEWWKAVLTGSKPAAPASGPSSAAAGAPPAAPAAALKLGVNERYRAGIELAAQRTGLDPAVIAAIIHAEAGPVTDKATRTKMADEAFFFNHPERDWEKRPLNAKDPADAELVKEWNALYASKGWDPKSYNSQSAAAGLTQFLGSTWKSEATRGGTYLNEVAKQKGFVGVDGKIVAGKEKDLLELRYDPTVSIMAAAEYDKSVFDRVSRETVKDNQQTEKAFVAKHTERDFTKQPLSVKDPKDAELVKEWTQIYNSSGTPLVPKDLTDDQKSRYLYLCHHEGERGAKRILSGSLTDGQARPLFEANVPSQEKRDALVKEHGSESKAYTQWLWGYVNGHIEPANFRK